MKPLTLADHDILKQYFEPQNFQLSAYSLLSIIAWNGACYQSHYEIQDEAVIVKTNVKGASPGCDYLILPVAAETRPSAVTLRKLASEMGLRDICFVPGDYVEEVGRDTLEEFFDVTEQPEYEDYIYLTDDLAGLKGNRYAKKRNLIHQFTREYVQPGRVETGRITAAEVPECLAFLEQWCAMRECNAAQQSNMDCEKAAVIQALNTIEALPWRGLWVRIDGKISAFGIVSHLTKEMGVLNFEKAYPQVKGLYQYLDNACAQELFEGYQYISKESDMGISALAESKKSYFPCLRLKSYCLRLKI